MGDRRVINTAGVALEEKLIRTLGEFLHGELVRPGDESYDRSRRVWNGMINKHPSMIAFCADLDDVVRTVRFARANELLVAVRSGGHNVAGNSVCDGGIVIDLSRMKRTHVNPSSLTVRAQAGLNWGELDRATQTYGLATTGGIVSRTGVAGLTLGGGIGWLMRKFGVTCDNVISANLVTAAGEFLTASAKENPDLFWAVRGGGGNFGVATEFEYRFHTVETLLAGTVYYPSAKTRDILRFYRDYITHIPDELSTMFAYLAALPTPYVRKLVRGSGVTAMHVCYAGPSEEGEKVLKPIRLFSQPLEDTVRSMPYVKLQSMLDSGSPPGLRNYWKSSHLKILSDAAIDTLLGYLDTITSPLSEVHLQHLGGAVNRVAEEEMAFSHRDTLCILNIVTRWEDPLESEKHMKWTQDFQAAMRPFSTGGVYVNFLGEEGEDRVKAAYGASKYHKLVDLKNKYDPGNIFHMNQNIKPSVTPFQPSRAIQ